MLSALEKAAPGTSPHWYGRYGREALPVCKDLNIELIGRSLPIRSNKKDEIKRAKAVGENFCTTFKEVNLEFMYEPWFKRETIHPANTHKYKIMQGNAKARLRMIYLYDLASKYNGMVLSTDNYTEYLLGFWTLHGDVGDYGMIQELWKTEVYELANYFWNKTLMPPKKEKALKDCIDAIPTDGLGITDSDLDQIGAKSYKAVDRILKKYQSYCGIVITGGNIELLKEEMEELEKHPVVQRHLNSRFKRRNPYNVARKNILKA